MAGLGFPGAEDLAAMFDFYVNGNPQRSIEDTQKLNKDIFDFASWVDENKDAFNEALE